MATGNMAQLSFICFVAYKISEENAYVENAVLSNLFLKGGTFDLTH